MWFIPSRSVWNNHLNFAQTKIKLDEISDKIYNLEPQSLREKEMFVEGFVLGNGTSRIYSYKSGMKYCWHLNILDFNLFEKSQRFCKEVWNEKTFKIFDVRESRFVYRISSGLKNLALEFDKLFTEKRKDNPLWYIERT